MLHGDEPERQYHEAVPAIEWVVLGPVTTTIGRGVGSDGFARAGGGVGGHLSRSAASSDVDSGVGSHDAEDAGTVTGWYAESGMTPGKRGSMPMATVVAKADVPATMSAAMARSQERGARLGNALDELGNKGHEGMLDRPALQTVWSGGVLGCQAPVIRPAPLSREHSAPFAARRKSCETGCRVN